MKDYKKYPPIVPDNYSDEKPLGALGSRRKKEEEEKFKEVIEKMSVEISLDPEINWTVKSINNKMYLSVKK